MEFRSADPQSERPERVASSPRGRIYFGAGRVLYLGPSLAVSLHEHHAVQLFLPLGGRIRLRGGRAAAWRSFDGAIVPSGLAHEADTPLPLLATLWLEPEAEPVRRLVSAASRVRITSMDTAVLEWIAPRLLACWHEDADAARALALVDALVEMLAPRPSPAPAGDPRVARARRILRESVRRRAPLGEVAAALSLSPSRLTHLFSSELGLSPSRYRLWLRLLDAVDALARGRSIVDAALEGGFSDAPHLTRTFRRMLGFTPAAAYAVRFLPDTPKSRIVQDAAPPPG